MAVQPAAPVATRNTGSSPEASSLSAPPELQKFELVMVAAPTHHCTRRSPSARSGGPANEAKSVK